MRDLSRRPCPNCKCDTLHITQKCSGCGRIDLNPSQQRAKRFRTKVVQLNASIGKVATANHFSATRARINAERRAWERRTGNRSCDRKASVRTTIGKGHL